MNEEMKRTALSDDELEAVSGGRTYYIFDASDFVNADPVLKIELLDENGEVRAKYNSASDAARFVESLNNGDNWVDLGKNYNEVMRLRGQR